MKKLVVIDEGHGGKDPGAIGNGRREKDEVLIEGKRLSQILKDNYDVDVMLMRGKDKFIGISERRNITNQMAKEYGVDNVAFVSLHWNSFHNNLAHGWEIWSNYPNTKGSRLADSIVREVKPILASNGITNRGKKYARGNLGVLRAKPATVLIEGCFISNANDISKYLVARDDLLKAYAKGISKYLNLNPKNKPKPTKDHWAKKHYDNLNEKGIKIEQERYDDSMTRGEVFALLDRIVK